MKSDSFTWAQRTRQQAIETIAYWLGRVNTSDLIGRFGVSRMIAHQDIKQYINLAPGNLSYSQQDKAYLVTSIFKLQLTSGVINEYLFLEGQNNPSLLNDLVTTVQTPAFELDPSVIRPVLRAIQRNAGVNVRYRSLTHPDGMYRDLFPHRLVNTGFRWHMRAYCDARQDFRDFNLSRIVTSKKSVTETPTAAAPELDKDWHTMVKLVIKPNPRLSKDEVILLEQEFAMKRGAIEVMARGALVPYTLQSYQIDSKISSKANPRQHRLILDNANEIFDYLW